MGVTLRQIEEAGALDELQRLFTTREDALSLIGSVPLIDVGDVGRLPAFTSGAANDYFERVARMIDASEGSAGLEALLTAAARLFPGSGKLGTYARAASQAGGMEARGGHALTIVLHDDLRDEELLELVKLSRSAASGLGRQAALDMITQDETGLCISIDGATEEEAEAIARSIRGSVRSGLKVDVRREPRAFRDYFMDPIFAEGPDGQRFALDHVRASTRVGDVAQAIMEQYEEAFWPTGKGGKADPVVDLRRGGDREVRRALARQTLHEAGVRPHDLLEVHPERRAGSVNPTRLAESLTLVKNQILDFARSHPGFEVQANATEMPTEYLFRFRAPGFAPGLAPGAPPRRIDEHEVLLVFPPDFPMKAPEAYFQREVFHPNVDAQRGLVCLGVLAESYRPGLHFGALCQMLVDMASFRNYELSEGYNMEASAWAASPEGQEAIVAIGGRPWGELHGRDERRARRVKLERLSP